MDDNDVLKDDELDEIDEDGLPLEDDLEETKKKPLEEIKLEELVSDISPKVEFLKFYNPPSRKAGRILSTVDELISALTNESKVI